MIAHIVLFRPKREVGVDGMRAFARTLQTVCRDVPSVKRAIAGRITDDKQFIGHTTYHYAAVIEFDDEDGLKLYLNSQYHKDLAVMFWRFCDSTVILDVTTVDVITGKIDELLV